MAFRGASADALIALTGELDSKVSTPQTAATVAGDLFTVASTFRSEGALRRFATDSAIPVEAKQGLVTDLFGGKIDGASLELLTSAVGRRWVAGRDLADAFEELSVVARVTSVGADSGRLADELFGFAQAVKVSPELRDALSDPTRSNSDKAVLIRTLLDGKALPATAALATQALSGTYRTVGSALAAYQKIAADSHGQGVATVRVAHELSQAEQQRLAAALERQYGRPVHLNLLVDPSVLGGIRVEIGDDVIDGTVSSRLEDARRRLVG